MHTRTAATLIVMLALVSAPPHARSQDRARLPEEFRAFTGRLTSLPDSASRRAAVDSLLGAASRTGTVAVRDSTVVFLYRGPGARVSVAGDPDGWDPREGHMQRMTGTDLWYLAWTLDAAARIEYKLVVDSRWILDPLNRLRAAGGMGENSEVRMPAYRFPAESLPVSGTPRGHIDTISIESTLLAHRLPVLVYLPAAYRAGGRGYPVMYVTDGGEFLTLAAMDAVLDNLIAKGEIAPVIAVFVDPRTDPRDPRTNTRMTDYALSDRFIRALTDELRPVVAGRYNVRGDPGGTGIMGASMGGLIATYGALMRADVFGLCGALSPSFQWEHDTLISMIRAGGPPAFRMYLATGTIRDALVRSRIVRDIMRGKGYDITYAEVPESHNWLNWRGRLRDLLRTFWGTR